MRLLSESYTLVFAWVVVRGIKCERNETTVGEMRDTWDSFNILFPGTFILKHFVTTKIGIDLLLYGGS